MEDFIHALSYYGLSARIKRLSDTLNSESRKMNALLAFNVEPNWHLVFLLLKEKSMSVTEIAKQVQFSHPAIVKIIQKMKARGYVKSVQDQYDSRKQLLSLTKKSIKMLPQFEQGWNQIQQILADCAPKGFIANIAQFEDKMKEESISERLEQTLKNKNE